MEITGGKAVALALKDEGVDHVFGLIGSAGMELFDALYDEPTIKFIGVRDERTGTHMADGFARASGKAGVVIAGQNGPGATNLVTGLAQANAAFSPVVALAGSLSSAHIYRDAFQEVDQQALFKPVTKKTWTVPQAKRLPEFVNEAFRTATAPRQGPVALNLPRDLLAESVEVECHAPRATADISGMCAPTGSRIDAIADLLRTAKRPVILAGGGVKNGRSHAQLCKLAELLNAPVTTSPGHGDAISCDHPLYAGQVGPRGNVVATRLMKEADVIIAVGTRLGFNSTFYTYDYLSQSAKIVQVEIESTALGRFFPVTYGVVADAGDFADSLHSALGTHDASGVSKWTSTFQMERTALLAERDTASLVPSEFIQPARLFKAIREVAPFDAMYTLDAGTLCLQATDALNYRRPPALFSPLDFGLVGFSYACGLGAQLACPDRKVISLIGDGGFGMAGSEIGTAVANGISSVCVVMNNGCWGAEKAYQRDFFDGRYLGADVPNPPYDKMAELWGARGFKIVRADQLEKTLDEAIRCGTHAIIDVSIDPNALYSFRRDAFKHRASSGK